MRKMDLKIVALRNSELRVPAMFFGCAGAKFQMSAALSPVSSEKSRD
jgi:hypothetical protein